MDDRPERIGPASGSQAQLLVPPLRSRVAAAGALAAGVGSAIALAVFAVRDLAFVLTSLLALALSISAWWIAFTHRGLRWLSGTIAVLLAAIAVAALVATERRALWLLPAIVGIAAAILLGMLALRWEIRAYLEARWDRVAPTERGVLLINPKSNNGRALRTHLPDEARRRGIEVVLLEPGNDLGALAEAAAARGADALGMAGGDGPQAIVASVAASHGLPFVCIPAGTRNHFALDLGVDRKDPVRALDAFGPAKECAIDLAEVNGEPFVNNVSLGLYAHFVASPEYRDAKRRTVAEMVPELLGPGAPSFGLHVERDGEPISDPQLVVVSNNPYTLSSLAGFGSRARLDTGALGVATVTISRTADVDRLVALEASGHPERFGGWREWRTPALVVGGPPSLAAAVDGEARTWDPPLRFTTRPSALRVRIGLDQTGASPALVQIPLAMSTFVGLARVVAGRSSGIVAEASQVAHDRT